MVKLIRVNVVRVVKVIRVVNVVKVVKVVKVVGLAKVGRNALFVVCLHNCLSTTKPTNDQSHFHE